MLDARCLNALTCINSPALLRLDGCLMRIKHMRGARG